MVIKHKQSRKRMFFESLCTALGWLFLISFIYVLGTNMNIEFNSKFYSLSLVNANAVITFTLIILALSLVVLSLWGNYNKKRYGTLNRRTFPDPTSMEEIGRYYSLTSSEVKELQEKRYIER